MKKYIRFGEIPQNERSGIYRGDIKIGEELGVSVYDTIYFEGKWRIVLPENLSSKMANSLYSILNSALQDEWKVETPCEVFLVIGDEIEKGSDNEPLIRNVRILEKISLKAKL